MTGPGEFQTVCRQITDLTLFGLFFNRECDLYGLAVQGFDCQEYLAIGAFNECPVMDEEHLRGIFHLCVRR
jgi:hypothetical protein